MRLTLEPVPRVPAVPRAVLVCGVIWLALAVATQVLLHAGVELPTVCPLKRVTGLPCPTCGATRCALALTHGHIVAAAALNPLVFAGGLVAAGVVLVRLVAGRRIRLEIAPAGRRVLLILAACAVLANWAYVLCAGR